MGVTTKIQWCDHTFNCWRGCQKIAPGCKNCYAETRANRWGEDFSKQRIRLSDSGWKEPLKWNREAEKAGERRRVFCASLADVFEDWQGPIVNHNGNVILQCDSCINPDRSPHRETRTPFDPLKVYHEHVCGEHLRPLTMDDLRRDLFALIDQIPHLDWLLLTKRPENIRRMWPSITSPESTKEVWRGVFNPYRANCWLLTSISNQSTADKQIPELLKCRDLVPVLGLSCEPLLGPVDLNTDCTVCDYCGNYTLDKNSWECKCGKPLIQDACTFAEMLDWVIVGGESGPHARPCDLAWIRALRDQCRAAGVACFVKQLGSRPYEKRTYWSSVAYGIKGAMALKLSDPKGGNIEEFPEDLRIREFPEAS